MPIDYCIFCDPSVKEKFMILENELFHSRWDEHPVSDGHALVVPNKHIISFFDLSDEKLIKMYDVILVTKKTVDEKYHPDAYNLGINEGMAAGRTVNHFHIHLIPRYKGDVENPRGGVRNIIPGKGDY